MKWAASPTSIVALLLFAVPLNAQVQSPNAVGYVNTTVFPGFNLVVNPLISGQNTTAELLTGQLPDESKIYFLANEGDLQPRFNVITWNASAKRFEPEELAGESFPPGRGFFIFLSGRAETTVTFAGRIPQGHLVLSLPAGYSLVASMVPQAGSLQALRFPAEEGDQVYLFNARTQRYTISTFDTLAGGWSPQPKALDVGEAFFLRKNRAVDWVRDFAVNQKPN